MPSDIPHQAEPNAAPPSFRPLPALSVAVAGHRRLSADGADARRIEAVAAHLLQALAREAARVAARDAEFFALEPPGLRVISRLSGEADIACMRAAEQAGCEVRAILASGNPAHPTVDPLVLADDENGDDARAETGQALLERADLLLAFWRGKADLDPGSTFALVQQAVQRRMPVLLLPIEEGGEVSLIDDPENHLLPPRATALPRVSLDDNLDRVVARVFAPPAHEAERQALRDCFAEPPAPRSHRPEYPALLSIAARRADTEPALPVAEEWARAAAAASRVSAEAAEAVIRTQDLQTRMEALSAFYARRARSGTVLRYGMPAVGAVFIALLAVLLPQYGLAWLGVQAVVMTLLVSESTWGARKRWAERWLDYRSLAERLRCDRFLDPCGIGSRRVEDETSAEDPAWMRWCHRRLALGIWTGGHVSPEAVAAAMRHLVEVEIPGQVRYHEGAAIQYRSLGKRLGLMANASALGMLGASLLLLALPKGGDWAGIVVNLLMSLLIILPSLFLASRGLRAEGGYELAAARSRDAAAALQRLVGLIEASPPTYPRLVRASLTAARAMILDTVDWRVGLQRSRTPFRGEPEAPASTLGDRA